jgi:hypothetical protein
VRVTRGLFQSFGASASLLAAAACALFAISAAVGFRGWPGLDSSSGGAPDLVVSAASPAKPRPQRVGRPSGAFAVSATAAHRVLAAAEPASGPRSAAAPRPRITPSTPAPAQPDSVAAPASTSPSPAAGAPSSPGRRLVDPVARTVRGTGDGVGATVAPVSPAAAQTVTDATDTVAGVVEKTGSVLAP